MSNKRSRHDRSSNSIQSDYVSFIPSLPSTATSESQVPVPPSSTVLKPTKFLKPTVKSSQPSSADGRQYVVGDFLQNCYYCNKKLNHNEEIFMYRDFCAFCSLECRDVQISWDKKTQPEDSEVISLEPMLNISKLNISKKA